MMKCPEDVLAQVATSTSPAKNSSEKENVTMKFAAKVFGIPNVLVLLEFVFICF